MEHCTVDIPDDAGASIKSNDSGLACQGEQKSIQHHTDEQINETINAGATRRQYFRENNERKFWTNKWLVNSSVPSFVCTEDLDSPVKVNASIRFTSWLLDTTGWEPGLYDVILGVSARSMHLENIESITFNISTDFKSFGPSEVTHRRDLTAMLSASDPEIVNWKLHRQLRKRSMVGPMMIIMEIRMTSDALSSELDPGYLKLHYMDFCIPDWRGQDDDAALRMHRSYIWSLNVCSRNEHDSQTPRETQKEIVHYAISGDGSYVTTLSVAGDSLHIELWDTSLTCKSRMEPNSAASPPQRCAEIVVPVPGLQEGTTSTSYKVSMSWAASHIALTDASALVVNPRSKVSTQSAFTVYRYHGSGRHGSTAALLPSNDYQHCSSLKNFHGYGKYHITAVENQDVKHELFITCDNKSISVYSTFQRWNLLRTITIDQPQDDPQFRIPASWRLIDGLRGCYFAWAPNNNDEVLVWNFESGLMKSFALWKRSSGFKSRVDDTTIAFSSDGAMMAILREGRITSHITASGTTLGSFVMPASYGAIKNLQFILNDTQILVNTCATDEDFGQGHVGIVLDAAKMILLDNFSNPGEYLMGCLVSTQQDRNLYAVSESTLDLICLDDHIVPPYSLAHLPTQSECDGRCENDLTLLSKQPTEFISSSSRLHFKVDICPASQDSGLSSVVVSVSSESGVMHKKLVIPPIHDRFDEWDSISKLHTNPWKYKYAAFLKDCSRLVVASRFHIMVWSVPTTSNGDFNLLLCHCIRRDNRDFSTTKGGPWRICPHQQLYHQVRYLNKEIGKQYDQIVMRPRVEQATYCEYGSSFAMGVILLVNNFQDADRTCRKAIVRYVATHISSHPNPDLPSDSLLAILCKAWRAEVHDSYEQVISAALELSDGRWMLRKDFDHPSNPLRILHATALYQPQAIGLSKAIIAHCFHKASVDRDTYYLLPIKYCLWELLAEKRPLSEFAMDILRRVAYFPVKSHRVILDYHIISHPPGFRWRFWKSTPRCLHECNAPILQLGHKRVDDQLKARFNDLLFTASFDMLWYHKDRTIRSSASWKGVQSRSLLSWLRAMGIIIWRKLRLQSISTVECHNFTLEMLDNPAIVALVEYKWNTIGFKYWLVRYLCQCCYYLLVLVVVFIQVYSDHHHSLAGVFIVIIICSCVFLWLELAQFARDSHKYSISMYNVVDLAVFGLPLAGSIDQLYIILRNTPEEGNAGLLSFSVLFIFLHFLFELRVYRSVCQFVTIIIRIIFKIRLFFFIFTGGILAFTIATLHLLRACPFGPCKEPETNFSPHFYKAISATYFFMGGRYDPINDELDSDNWAFHTLMIVYFTFTVILMLNVLIALINLAFTDSDGTWRQVWIENRLRLVESAENMSYDIPGFRQLYSWFPEEVYYSASARDVQDYFSNNDMDMTWGELSQRTSGGNNFMIDMVPAKSSSTKPTWKKQEQRYHEQAKAIESMKLQMKNLQSTLETQNLLFQEQLQEQLREQQLAQDEQMKRMLEEVTSFFKKK